MSGFNENLPFIFISYSHKDSAMVCPIIQRLRAEGFNVWYDDGIEPGSEWDENIAEHITGCSYFIAFISANYMNSHNCKDELNYSRDLDKERLLIYLEDVSLTSGMAMRMNRNQAIYWLKFPNVEQAYQKLFKAVGIEKTKVLTPKIVTNNVNVATQQQIMQPAGQNNVSVKAMAHVSNQVAAPVANQPKPMISQTAPMQNQQKPIVNQATHMSNQPKPVANQPMQVPPQAKPIVNQSAKMVNQTAPMVNQTVPMVNQSAPMVNQTAPMVNQTAPIVNQSVPMTNQTAPMANQPKAAANRVVPVQNQQKPAVNQQQAVMNQSMPIKNQQIKSKQNIHKKDKNNKKSPVFKAMLIVGGVLLAAIVIIFIFFAIFFIIGSSESGSSVDKETYNELTVNDLIPMAEEGDLNAMYCLGVAYLEGTNGAEADNKKAVYWFDKAVAGGDIHSMETLSELYYFQEYGVERNYAKVVDLCHMIIEQDADNVDAMFMIGACYYKGNYGIEQNYEEAFYWYMQAANYGHLDSMLNVALCYQYGIGVEQNDEKCSEWLNKYEEAGGTY